MHRRRLIRGGFAAGLNVLWLKASSAIGRANPRRQMLSDGNETILAAAGAISPAAVPGYQLRLVHSEWGPDLPSVARSRSGACVACVGSGQFTIAIDSGDAIAWPSPGTGQTPAIHVTPLDPPLVCHTGDCVAFDADTVATVLAAHPTGDKPAVLWEARFALVPLARSWQCG